MIHSSRLARGREGLVVLVFAHQIDIHEEVIHEYNYEYSSCVVMWRVTSSQNLEMIIVQYKAFGWG